MSETKYRLDLYTHNGLLRPEIPRAVFADMSKSYGDIIRAISSSAWVTIEEIIESYQNLQKRLRFDLNRSNEQIEQAVISMVEGGLVLQK